MMRTSFGVTNFWKEKSITKSITARTKLMALEKSVGVGVGGGVAISADQSDGEGIAVKLALAGLDGAENHED